MEAPTTTQATSHSQLTGHRGVQIYSISVEEATVPSGNISGTALVSTVVTSDGGDHHHPRCWLRPPHRSSRHTNSASAEDTVGAEWQRCGRGIHGRALRQRGPPEPTLLAATTSPVVVVDARPRC